MAKPNRTVVIDPGADSACGPDKCTSGEPITTTVRISSGLHNKSTDW
jgi:hypothetical protein